MENTFPLSKLTMDYLTNMASINPQLTFQEGTAQRTNSPLRNFIADYAFDAPVPRGCSIGDMSKLLGILRSCKADQPSLVFDEQALRIPHQYGEVTLLYAASASMHITHQFEIRDDYTVAEFDLPADLWATLLKQASVMECKRLQFSSEDGVLVVSVVHDKDALGGSFGSATFEVPNADVGSTEPYTLNMRLDSMHILSGDYRVRLGGLSMVGDDPKIYGGTFTLKDDEKSVVYTVSGQWLPR